MGSDTVRAIHLARILAEQAAADRAASDLTRTLHLQLASLHWERLQALDARADSDRWAWPRGGGAVRPLRAAGG